MPLPSYSMNQTRCRTFLCYQLPVTVVIGKSNHVPAVNTFTQGGFSHKIKIDEHMRLHFQSHNLLQ